MFMKKFSSLIIILSLALIIPACGGKSSEFKKHMKEGEKFYGATEFEKAIDEFKKASELIPEDPNPYQNIAVCYSNLFLATKSETEHKLCAELSGKAIEYYKKVLEKDPERVNTQIYISNEFANTAAMFMDDGDLPNGRVYLKKWLEFDPANSDAYYRMGVLDWGLCFAEKKPELLLSCDDFLEKISSNEDAVKAIAKSGRLKTEQVEPFFNLIKTSEDDVIDAIDKKVFLEKLQRIKGIDEELAEKILACTAEDNLDTLKCIVNTSPDLSFTKSKQARAIFTKSPDNMAIYISKELGTKKTYMERAIRELMKHVKYEAIADGMEALNKSIEINPSAPDTHQYMTMLYVEKIKLERDKKLLSEYAKKAEESFVQATKLRTPDKSEEDLQKDIKQLRSQLKQLMTQRR